MRPTHSPTLDRIIAATPPPKLYHYTSPEGLLGIIKSKEARATNIWYVSDAMEIDAAVQRARDAIQSLLAARKWADDERQLLEEMNTEAGSATKQVYAFSMSEQPDLLSQWRAYCPPSGGYAIGLPSVQLKLMAAKQGFYLCRCVYQDSDVYQIVSELVETFVEHYRRRRGVGEDPAKSRQTTTGQFVQHLGLFGAAIKHGTFREECEWRLFARFGVDHPQVDFRTGARGIIPFFRFHLADDDYPNLAQSGTEGVLTVVVGPTSNFGAAQIAVQTMLMKYLPGAAHSSSATPYRTW